MESKLPGTSPWSHRVLHALCQKGWRVARLWPWLLKAVQPPPQTCVRIGGALLPLPMEDGVGRAIYFGVFEAAEMAVISALMRRGDTGVDVGANLGRHTLQMAASVGSGGKVIAAEPNPEVFQWLSVAASDLPFVRTVRVAIDPEYAQAILSKPDGYNQGQANLMGRGDDCDTEVACVPLHALLAGSSIARVRLLKIDVEGWEKRVLSSAGNYLSGGLIDYILAEVSPEFGGIDFVDDLVGRGYHAWRIDWKSRSVLRLRGGPALARVNGSLEITKQTNILFALDQAGRERREVPR